MSLTVAHDKTYVVTWSFYDIPSVSAGVFPYSAAYPPANVRQHMYGKTASELYFYAAVKKTPNKNFSLLSWYIPRV
jgi:hypothetical protein